jgi:hypothetical protein
MLATYPGELNSSGEKNRNSMNQPAVSHNRASLRRNGAHVYGTRIASSSRQKRKIPRLPNGKQWLSKFHTPRGFERFERDSRHDVSSEHDTVEVALLGNDEGTGNNECAGYAVAKQDQLETFLGDNESAIPSWQGTIIREFFLEHEDHNGTVQGVEPWVWMDDREHPSGRSRVITRGLTLPKLYEQLKRKVSCTMIKSYCTCG